MKSGEIDRYIRKQVKTLMEELGVKKVRLGAALGGKKGESRQQEFARAQRFLTGNGEVKVGTLAKLVDFFGKPFSYFLPEKSLYPQFLKSSVEKPVQKELKDISSSLRNLGLDEEFIKSQLRQIEAMEAYNVEGKK